MSGLRCWLPPHWGTPFGPSLHFGSRISPLSPSCRQTLLNLTVPCGRRGWGLHDTSPPTQGFPGSSLKFKFPLARFFLDPSAAPGLRGFLWENDLAWKEVGVVSLGSGGQRQHRGQRICAAAAGREALGLRKPAALGEAGRPAALCSPNALFPFLCGVCLPSQRRVGSLKQRSDRAGILQNGDRS